ncbi:hypothetical protein N9L68_00815 [bacterium]|nr:hypothetical protein [bacterium]
MLCTTCMPPATPAAERNKNHPNPMLPKPEKSNIGAQITAMSDAGESRSEFFPAMSGSSSPSEAKPAPPSGSGASRSVAMRPGAARGPRLQPAFRCLTSALTIPRVMVSLKCV